MANNFIGSSPTGQPGSGGTIVDGQGHVHYVSAAEADAYRNKGFANRIGQIGPYASMALMGYGAATGGTGTIGALGGGSTAVAPTVSGAAPAAGAIVPAAVAPVAKTIGAMGQWGGQLAGAGVGALANIYGQHQQNSAYDRAAVLQAEGLDKQLAYDREIEARRRQEYDTAEAQMKAQWDARQSRLEPYRQAAAAILGKWSKG